MFEELQKELCSGCGEIKPEGLIPTITHSCPKNTFEYRIYTGQSLYRMLQGLFGKDEMQQFKDLLHFEHFNPMPNFENASTIDKICYHHARQSDIRTMKRLREYIRKEEIFNESY